MNGRYNNSIEWIRAVLLTVVCFAMAISIALFIVVNVSPLFIDLPTKALDLSKSKILGDYWQIIRYLQVPWQDELKLSYIPITRSAIHHFQDVRQLFLLNELALVITTYLAISGLKREKRQAQLWRLNLPFQMMFLLVSFGSFMLFTNFDRSFIGFHYLVFNNMDWVFNPHANPVVLLMPESFFGSLFSLTVVITIAIALLIWLWMRASLRTFLRKF